MSLKQIADRFEIDEGNVFSLYEECFPIVKLFFAKLWNKMTSFNIAYRNFDYNDSSLPTDPSELHPTLLKTLIIAVQHMILTGKKCDLDCLDEDTWNYLRIMLCNSGLIYR